MIPIMMYLSEDDVKAWHSFSNFTLQVWMMVIVAIYHIVRYQHVNLWSKILISLHDMHISNVLAIIAFHHMVRYQYVKLRCKFFVWYLDLIQTRHNANYSNHSISWWCKHDIDTHIFLGDASMALILIYFSPFVINKKHGSCDTRRTI